MSTQKDRQKTKFLNINVGIVIFGLILIYLFINRKDKILRSKCRF